MKTKNTKIVEPLQDKINNLQKIKTNTLKNQSITNTHLPQKHQPIPSNLHKPTIKPNNKIPIKKQIKQPSTTLLPQQQLYPCPTCERTFNQIALQKHTKICKKVFVNKRKQFNSAKQRIISKQQINIIKKKKINQKDNTQSKNNKIPLWKQQSLAFRIAMKQVRNAEKTQQQLNFDKKNLSNLIKCKFCGRSFNETAASKHISFCQKKQKQQAIKKLPKK